MSLKLTSMRSPLHNYCLCFDLDEYFGGDQAADFYHAGGRADFIKEFAVGLADLPPVVNVRDVDARAHNVLHAGARPLERGFDVLKHLNRLRVGVSNAGDLPVSIGGRGARYVNGVSHADGARVADDGFPGSAG